MPRHPCHLGVEGVRGVQVGEAGLHEWQGVWMVTYVWEICKGGVVVPVGVVPLVGALNCTRYIETSPDPMLLIVVCALSNEHTNTHIYRIYTAHTHVQYL